MNTLFSIRLSLGLLFSIFFHQFSFAQYDDILKNDAITWAAEFTTDLSLDINPSSKLEISNLLKFYNPSLNFDDANRTDHVRNWLYSNALEGKYECYSDPNLSQKLSSKDLNALTSSIDTVITYNPETFEEKIVIVRNDLNPNDVSSMRMNQVIYYDGKTKDFGVRLLSIGFLILNEQGTAMPIFWVKMNEPFPDRFNINSEDIAWGALISSKKGPMNLNFIQEVKNSNGFKLQKVLYDDALDGKKTIESSMGFGSDTPLTPIEVENLYNSVDTVVTFNPDTYEEHVVIIKNDFDPMGVKECRLVQEWYYDRKTLKLMSRLRAISPLVRVKDDAGNYRYSRPMYYIRFD